MLASPNFFRHFGKVPGVVINLGSNPHIGQPDLALCAGAGGVAGGQRPDGNARQQQEKGQRWQQTGTTQALTEFAQAHKNG